MTASPIQQQVDLTRYNSFGVSQTAAYFANIQTLEQLQQALHFAEANGLPLQILGDGTNTLFIKDYPGLILHMDWKGIEWIEGEARIKAACGESWHGFVIHCLNIGLYGIENLALIPGTIGAAPIQNIGAYGVELEQFFSQLEVYDVEAGEVRVMSKQDCEFSYRDSIFKREAGQKLIVLSMTLELRLDSAPNTDYQALKAALPDAPITAQLVFDTVCQIRRRKLPDPAKLGNAGSFFKNPVVSRSKVESLKQQYPALPAYATDDAQLLKLPAAWLLQEAGCKSMTRGGAAVHEDHALVLVNQNSATGEDIRLLAQEMSSAVLHRFGIDLQVEVRII